MIRCSSALLPENTKTLVIEGSGAMADYGFETSKAPWVDKKFASVVFPEGITSVGDSAFNGCYYLASIAMLATKPPSIDKTTFEGVSTSTCRLYFPDDSLNAYK